MSERVQMQFVTVKGKVYIAKESIAEYILEIAGGEETDVRDRLEEAVRNLNTIGDAQ